MGDIVTSPPNLVRWSSGLAPAVTSLTRSFYRLFPVRPNASKVHPELDVEHWSAVSDGQHNLTTDMIRWRGSFFLVHASSPWHIASDKSRLVVWRSSDARHWHKVTEVSMPGGDIRDPKFAVINDRLFLYVLANVGFVAEPCATSYTVTDDGVTWTKLEACSPPGWLFWRAKTLDHKTWYLTAYWNRHGRSALLKSTDGKSWEMVSIIHEGDYNDETDFEFLPDGSILATARLEMSSNLFGHRDACTMIAVSKPPYTTWERARCQVTRLDGPNLFRLGDEIFAVGRHHLEPFGFLRERGSFLGHKRTALYRVSPKGLTHLSDLPSGGDTGYPGLVQDGNDLYVCYYTNDIERDYRWLPGMFLPSEIRMAKLGAAKLQALSRRTP